MAKDKQMTNNSELILKTAHTLFLSKGYNGTSIRDIAKNAGVSLGGVYALFKNKEEIYESLLTKKLPFLHLLEVVQKHQDKKSADFFRSVAHDWYQVVDMRYFRLLFIDWVEFKGATTKRILPKEFPKKVKVIAEILKAQINRGEIKNYDPFLIFRGFIQMLTIYIVTDDFLSGFSATKKPIDKLVDIYLTGILKEQ